MDNECELTAIVKHVITTIWSRSAYEAAIVNEAAISDAEMKFT